MIQVRFRGLAHGVAGFCMLCAVDSAPRASAQCTDFARGFAPPGVGGGSVEAFTLHDDGSGVSLFVGGSFVTAGDVVAHGVARWDGAAFHALAGGVGGADPRVMALLSADLGSGPRLYAGGAFTSAGGGPAVRVAVWDGAAWTALGNPLTYGHVTSLAAFDDGAGLKLYAGCEGAVVIRWDGASWSIVGTYFQPTAAGAVRSLAVFDDGSGARLYAGGNFTSPGARVARLQGSGWAPLGAGVDGEVTRLRVLDDGAGPALYACGAFLNAGGIGSRGIARWSAGGWSGLAGIASGTVRDVAFGTDGSAAPPALIVTGAIPGNQNLARREAGTWQGIGEGLRSAGHALAHSDAGTGGALIVGGSFESTGGTTPQVVAHGIVERRDGQFRALHQGGGADASVEALASFDAGSGPELFAGGNFDTIGPLAPYGLSRHDGNGWVPLPPGGVTTSVRALHVHDDGGGPALYVGQYSNLRRWNGATWSTPGAAPAGAETFLTYDDGSGPKLYAGGTFTGKVQRWDGAVWATVGAGLPHPVACLAAGDLGPGLRLYAGQIGIGGTGVGLHQWNGTGWTLVGGGISGYAAALTLHDDGTGLALYVGGGFLTVGAGGAVAAPYLARFDGAAWSSVGGGMNGPVQALRVFDDGGGPALFAAGNFTQAGGVPAKGFARWDGIGWRAVGDLQQSTSLSGIGYAFEVFDDGSGPALFVGGTFRTAGTRAAGGLAKWSCGPDRGAGWCAGDGVDPYVNSACPCGNFGAPGHGCGNSAQAGGARLVAASGSVPADDVVLTCLDMPAATTALFVKGSAPITGAAVFGDGLRCVTGSLLRLGTKTAIGGSASFPGPADPSLAMRSATPPGSGIGAWYQVYYRNVASYCTTATFNLSNGWRIRW